MQPEPLIHISFISLEMAMKIEDFGTAPYACSYPDCKVTGAAEHMWHIRGTNLVLCGRHGNDARARGHRTFRVSQTLEYLGDQALKADHYFAKVKELVRETPERRGKPRR